MQSLDNRRCDRNESEGSEEISDFTGGYPKPSKPYLYFNPASAQKTTLDNLLGLPYNKFTKLSKVHLT